MDRWHKKSLNWALVLFSLVYKHISRFLASLFELFCAVLSSCSYVR